MKPSLGKIVNMILHPEKWLLTSSFGIKLTLCCPTSSPPSKKTFERGIGQGLQAKLRKVFAETFETEEAVFDSDEGLVLRKLPHVSIGQVMAVVHPVKVLTVRFITSLALIFQANCKTP